MAGGAKKKKVARGSKNNKKKKDAARDAVSELTDDVLADILSRVPIKSLCRCKSVCRRWRDLISHPEHRKKLPQTLAGFFYESYDRTRFPISARHFINVSGAGDPQIDPSLSFLPRYESIDVVDSCNGLLLCRGWKSTDPVTMDYVVCNPGTEEWVVVPDSGWSSKATFYKVRIVRLGFDPGVSSHFHVFEFIPDDVWYMNDQEEYVDGRIEVVAIYSSKAGVWSFNEDHEWGGQFAMPMDSKSVFLNGVLHLVTYYGMVYAIDVKGNVLRAIPIPRPDYDECNVGGVYVSQGHLYFAGEFFSDESGAYELSVWVLEDYNSEKWSLKHNVNPLHMFGEHYYSMFGNKFSIISIHPEHGTIFMVCGTHKRLMSYEMGRVRLRSISRLGSHSSTPYIPYVPLFSGSLADEH
ncbi:unnamed protein product [Urochloa decumbens]|uniref:F-box domain-containing protein n=1 Tax=Urochloa decumbens TaxID=240449 RepID=A0ABC9BQL4_9POAL